MKRASAEPAPSTAVWRRLFARLFSIDPRSMAVFRVAMGSLLLADIAIRLVDLNSMYTDDGMFSRAEICRHYSSVWNWSFHFATGSPAGQGMFFALAAILAVLLAIGWQTRVACVGSWLMLVSVQHRIPAILSGADELLSMLLFWAMFLPLGRTWSIDAAWERRRNANAATIERQPVLSIASAAILLQMGMMYLFSAIFKTNGNWIHGDAIAGALQHSFYASRWAGLLLSSPNALKALTWCSFALEWAAPILLFFPFRTALLRPLIVAALVAMHLGIAIFLEVDLFSPVSIAGLTLFLPARFWELRKSKPASDYELRPAMSGGSLVFKISQGFCAVVFLYVLALNIDTLPSHSLKFAGIERWKPLFIGLNLGQKWGMFETAPSNNGWYVARAKLDDGSEVDLLRAGAPVDWSKPAHAAALYRTFRWRKLFREMSYFDEIGFQVFRSPAASYMCQAWNLHNSPDRQISEFDFMFCHENPEESLDPLKPRITRESLFHLDFSGT